MRLSIVLPTYNERKNLPLVIEKIEAALSDYQGQYEILIVDDNSPDKTYALGREISRKKIGCEWSAGSTIRVFLRQLWLDLPQGRVML